MGAAEWRKMDEVLRNSETDGGATNEAGILSKEPSFEEHMEELNESEDNEDLRAIEKRREELIGISSDFFKEREKYTYDKICERIEGIEEPEKRDLAVAVLGELKGKNLCKKFGYVDQGYGFDRECLVLALDYIEDEAKCKDLLAFYKEDYYRCVEKDFSFPYASGGFYSYAEFLHYSIGVVEDMKEGQGIDREMQPGSDNSEINNFIEGLGRDEAYDAGVTFLGSPFKESYFYPKALDSGFIVESERPASEKGTVEYLARRIAKEYNDLSGEEKKLKLAELDSLGWFYGSSDFNRQRIRLCKELGDREEIILYPGSAALLPSKHTPLHSVEQLTRQACAINNMEKAVAKGEKCYDSYQKARKNGKEILSENSGRGFSRIAKKFR